MRIHSELLRIHTLGSLGGVSLGLFLASMASLPAQITIDPDLIIDLPEINLLPNTPGQTFEVFIQNNHGSDVQVNGIGFNIQVADGGPPAGGLTSGPTITAVDILTGTIFATPNNNGARGGQIVPQVFYMETQTPSGTVGIGVSSKVATVTVDTSGFFSGTFSLTLDTKNGPAKYTDLSGDLYPTLYEGTLSVPEPRATALVGGLLLGWGWGWRRLHRRNS